MLLAVLLVQLVFVTVPASVIFEDCGSAYNLQVVNIDGCGRWLPCYVTLGEAVPVSVQFYAGFASRQLDQDVVININLINLSTKVTPDPCQIVDCPVRINAATSFTSVMSVPNIMAVNQRGYLHWRVYNERGRLVLCYSVLVQTQSSLQKLLRQALAEITPEANEIVDNLDLEFDLSDIRNVNNTGGHLQDIIDRYYMNQQKQDESVVN